MVLSPQLKQRVAKALRGALAKLTASKSQELCCSCQTIAPVWMICDGKALERLDVVCAVRRCMFAMPFAAFLQLITACSPPSLHVYSQKCLNSPDFQQLLSRARANGGICPLCCVNRLLPTPFEYEVAHEPLRSAKELITIGDSYGVALQGQHGAGVGAGTSISSAPPTRRSGSAAGKALSKHGVSMSFKARPRSDMPRVDTSMYRSIRGELSEVWWRGELSFLSK